MRDEDTVTFDIFESLAPPDIDLGTARAAVFQSSDTWDGHTDLARSLAISGGALPDVIARIAAMKGYGAEPFARSQLYAALRSVRARSQAVDYRDTRASALVEDHLFEYARRVGLDPIALIQSIPCFGIHASGSPTERPLAFDVAMTTQLWDYVHPLRTDLPPFPAEEP